MFGTGYSPGFRVGLSSGGVIFQAHLGDGGLGVDLLKGKHLTTASRVGFHERRRLSTPDAAVSQQDWLGDPKGEQILGPECVVPHSTQAAGSHRVRDGGNDDYR